jgi:MFS family permease
VSASTPDVAATSDTKWRRDFFLLWTGNAVSAVGSAMSYFLFPVLGLALTGSPSKAALAASLYTVGRVVLRLPAGVFVDGHSRRTVLLAANLTAAALYGAITVSIVTSVAVFQVLLVGAFLTGVASSLLDPAEQSAIRTIVPVPELPSAMSKNQARAFGAGLVGPPLAGLLFGVAHGLPFLVDAATFATAAMFVVFIRSSLGSLASSVDDQRSVLDRVRAFSVDVKTGIRRVASRGLLRATVAYSLIANFAVGALFTAVTLKLLLAGVAPVRVGLVDTAVAVAGLAGALAGPWFIARVPVGWLSCAAIFLLSLGILPSISSNSVFVVGVSLSLCMLVAPAANTGVMSYVFATTPLEMQGTVSATIGFFSNCIAPLGPVCAGLLVAWIGAPATLAAICVATLSSMVPLLASREVRSSGTPDTWEQAAAEPARGAAAVTPRSIKTSQGGQ